MADIISLAAFKQENSPHWEGLTKCVSCGHKWHHVAPIGTWWVECPECGLDRGHPYHPFGAQAGESIFTCNCGSEALTAYFRNGIFRFQCMSCGVDHSHAIFGDAP